MAAIKAMQEKLVKENKRKKARINLQEEKITYFTKKLEKRLAWFSKKTQKVRMRRRCLFKLNLPTKRYS